MLHWVKHCSIDRRGSPPLMFTLMFDTSALITGFTATFVLIATIGAQSAFVLRQGIAREYALRAALCCFLIDVAFIAAGVAGIGVLIERLPWFMTILRILGTGYLLYLAWQSVQHIRNPTVLVAMAEGRRKSPEKVIKEILGITLLNAQMYVDLVLISVLAGAFGSVGKWWYYVGAIAASGSWFFGLAIAGALLAPFFQSRRAWQAMEAATAVVMLVVAWHLFTPLVW